MRPTLFMPIVPARTSPLFLLLVCLGCVGGLRAQPDPTELRSRFQSGEAEAAREVLQEVLRLFAQGSPPTAELALVGAEAAHWIGEWNHAVSLGTLAATRGPKTGDGKPTDSRGLELAAHARWSQAQELGPSDRLAGATFQEAAMLFGRARDAGGDPFRLAYFEAMAWQVGGVPGKGLEAVEIALRAEPEAWDALLLRIQLLLESEKFGEGLAAARGLPAEPLGASPRALSLLVQAAVGTGDPATIRDALQTSMSRAPEVVPPYQLAWDRFGVKDPAGFRRILESGRQDPAVSTAAVPLFYLSRCAAQAGDLEVALQWMTQYRERRPDYPEGWLETSVLLRALGRLPEAQEDLSRAYALGGLAPDLLADAYGSLAGEFAQQGVFPSAIEAQRQRVGLTKSVEDELQLARLYHHGGRRADAIALLQRLLEDGATHDPSLRSVIQNDLGIYFRGAGQLEDAARAFASAADDDPGSLDARENLGIALLELGRTQEGAAALRQCLAVDPARVRTRYHLLRLEYPHVMGAGSR